MSQIIKNEEELTTATDPDLITEHYNLEILGLKSPVDFRKFSRSFMRLSKIVFGIESKLETTTPQEMTALVDKYKAKEE